MACAVRLDPGCGAIEFVRAPAQKCFELHRINSRSSFRRRGSYRCFLYVFGRGQHFLRTVGEAVHLASPAGTLLVLVEGVVNAAQYGLESDAGILPGLDQGPVERRKKKDGSAAALEVLLDFGEIVEVVFHGTGPQCVDRGRAAEALPSPDVGFSPS